MSKSLPIAEAFYSGYSLLFFFDNATSYSIYANNLLCIGKINKSSSNKQVWLSNNWYEKDNAQIEQSISY